MFTAFIARTATALRHTLAAIAGTIVCAAAGAQSLDEENRAQQDKINDLLAQHNAAWGASWSPAALVSIPAGAAAYTYNNILKVTRPVLQPQAGRSVLPDSADGCSYGLRYTHNVNEVYTDYLGLGPGFDPGGERLDADWGILGKPYVYHGNSDVRVETRLNGLPFGLPGNEDGVDTFELPIGRHLVRFTATTQISDLFDIPPWYALGMLPALDGARKSLGRELLEAAVLGTATNLGSPIFNKIAKDATVRDTNARTERVQSLFVLDTVHPRGGVSEPVYEVDAIDVGGRLLTPALERQVRLETLDVSDRCRGSDELEVRLVAPRFMPVDRDVTVQWRVLDPGPSSLPTNPPRPDPDFPDIGFDDTRNEIRIEQIWRIVDKRPPIIEPPEGRVIESDGLEETVTLGRPAVFDLVDPNARVEAFIDGVAVQGDEITVSSLSRTEVVWRATDRSTNQSEKSQWITVKPTGTNNAPEALAGNESAVSFEETQIELLGRDTDPPIGGRYDQLAFSIARPPANGEFVAPLFPFFIEDYRVEANLSAEDQVEADTGDGLGGPPDGLVDAIERNEYFKAWCEDPVRRFEPLPRDLVTMPEYIAVTDDGTTFVRDTVLSCNTPSGEVRSQVRIAQFDDAENLVAELLLPSGSGTLRSFWIGPDGFLYFKVPGEPRVTKVDPTPVPFNPGEPDRMMTQSIVLQPPNDESGFVRNLSEIRSVATDARGLLYVTDGAAAYVFDMNQNEPGRGSESARFVGDLVPRGAFSPDASTNGEMDITIDSDNNVYFSDEELQRVWKYAASSYEPATSTFVAGRQIGWLGRCSGNRTEVAACDTLHQRSFGFECTDALCNVDTSLRDVDAERAACGLPPGSATFRNRAGCGAGQFDRPRGIAINADDILYVADFNNFRIQRFNTDGMLGGEAVSECDGTCFVLGDFGKPIDVSVNLKHFYVLDREFDLLHVFETTPITNVQDANLNLTQNAFVTYRSDNNFRGLDTFEFVVGDGLADSAPATMTIDVRRNRRPPEAIAASVETPEDIGVDITLTGADPDADTLRFAIVDEPANGRLEGRPPILRYLPNENFQGRDLFTFVVDDGLTSSPAATSEPAVVTIDVLPAPDDPTLEVEFAARTGVAYDTDFAAYSFDPDVGDIASVTIEWGDGDVQAATRNPQAIGIWPVIYDDSSFEARIEGTHTYNNPGTYTLRVCISDSVNGASLSTCDEPDVKTLVEQTVVVDELIDLVVTTDDSLPKFEEPDCPAEARANDDCPLRSEPVIDGNPVTYIATIENRQLGDNTQPATNIEASFEFPPELTPIAVQIAAPGGEPTESVIDGQIVTATIPSLAVEATATVSVLTNTPGNLIEDRRVDVNGKVRRVLVVDGEVTEPEEFADPSGRNPIARQTQILLDPEGDVDGDGVPNGEDAFPGDPNESRDNDGDGIGDNGDPDDDNDRMPDHWERRFGFDPFNAGEGTLDGDGDGLLNEDEYLAGTRPDVADSDRDGRDDASDICPTVFDRNQLDLDTDGVGDACDAQAYAAVAQIGDLDAGGAVDYVLVETANGNVEAYPKDSATNVSTGAGRIVIGDATTETLRDVTAETSLARIAAFATDADGNPVLRIVDAVSGTSVGEPAVFDDSWSPVAVEALANAELLVVANSAANGVGIERRRAADGSLISAATPLPDHHALASAGSAGGYGVLAYDLETGALELVTYDTAGDSEIRRWQIAGNEWLAARLAGDGDDYAVVTQSVTGTIDVTVFSPLSDVPLTSYALFDTDWTLIDAVGRTTTTAVMAVDGSGEIQIRVVGKLDGREIGRMSHHTAADLPRAMTAGPADVGALASTAGGDVSLELRAADGGNLRVLTAESTMAPPPSPPPPPPPGPEPTPGGGGGGGGAFGFVALWIIGIAGLRRRARGGLASRQ